MPKNIFVDINIFIDVFQKRSGSQASAQVLALTESSDYVVYSSAHGVTTIAYLLEKSGGSIVDIKFALSWLLADFIIVATTQQLLKTALQSQIVDYEDAVIEQAAFKAGATVIITRNLKDFERSRVRAVSPEQFLAEMA